MKNQNEEGMVCDICLDEEGEEDDQILICELCLVAVHQSCYGREIVSQIPVGEWYCERCSFLIKHEKDKEPEKSLKCQLCSDEKGVIIKVLNFGWVHIVCVNWFPDIYFIDEETKNSISGQIHQDRYKLRCNICAKTDGACIQCDYKNCVASFHVRCGIRAGLIKKWDEMNQQRDTNNDYVCAVFCRRHQRSGRREIAYSGMRSILPNEEEKSKNRQKKLQGLEINQKPFFEVQDHDYQPDVQDQHPSESDEEKEEVFEKPRPKPKHAKKTIPRQTKQNQTLKFHPNVMRNHQGNGHIMQKKRQKKRAQQPIIYNPYASTYIQPPPLEIKPVRQLPSNPIPQPQLRRKAHDQMAAPRHNPIQRPSQNRQADNITQASGTEPMFSVNKRFAAIIGVQEVANRKQIQTSFINFAIKEDLVDLKTHFYLIYRNPDLRNLLGIDIIPPREVSCIHVRLS